MSDGKAADRKSIWAMRRLGLDLGGHSSTRVSRALENKPDLILTMSGEHLQLLAELDSGMSERAFTLKAFVELADIEGPRRSREQMADYVSRVSAGRSFSGLTSPNRAKDIGDPIGRRKRAFYKCAMELKDLIHLLSILLYDIDTTPPPQEGLSPSPRTEAESSGDTD